jgi:hypothetical protein
VKAAKVCWRGGFYFQEMNRDFGKFEFSVIDPISRCLYGAVVIQASLSRPGMP